jgi:hypothetical protein
MTYIEHFFSEVKSIHAKYEHIARLTGENFNIFKILDVQSSEVRLHSAFIAELLNVQGSHGQGSKYLELFLSQSGIDDTIFDLKTSKIFVEYRIGEVDNKNKEGGNIDILLQDDKNRCIVIENKIYAGDQRNQLKRYHNFLLKQNGGKLFYLNLTGDKPSKDSYDDLIEEKGHYRIIAYKSEIKQWLEECLKASVNLPIIRETIQQYIILIKKLTNQSTNITMDDEIINLMTETPEKMKVAHRIVACFDGAKQKVLQNFWETLCKTLKEKGLSVEQRNYNKGTKEIFCLSAEIKENYKDYKLCWSAEVEENFYIFNLLIFIHCAKLTIISQKRHG